MPVVVGPALTFLGFLMLQGSVWELFCCFLPLFLNFQLNVQLKYNEIMVDTQGRYVVQKNKK